MEAAIDPTFSVYGLVGRVEQQSTLLSHRRTMSIVSYEIENATLIDGARTRVFSSFQYMHKFLPQVARYRRLAETAESVYVFGVPDCDLPSIPNVHYVPLSPTDQLAREWFLISFGRDYCCALATEEQSRFTDPDDQRVFKGIWTFNLSLGSILEAWLTSTVGARSLDISEHDIHFGSQTRLMLNTLDRFSTRLQRRIRHEITQYEVAQVVTDHLKPQVELSQTANG
jgi:hypothetical protein